MALRWILGARNSMQRIGLLLFVCESASKTKSITREKLGQKLRVSLKAPTEVIWSDVSEYIERLRSSGARNRYKGAHPPLTTIEYQDALLADLVLPSSSGAVTDEVAVDLVDEAVAWGLVRAANYTLTDRGLALNQLRKESASQNPLLLDRRLRHACCFWYLSADGDALRCAYENINTSSFNREQLGKAIGFGIESMLVDRGAMNNLDRGTRTRLKGLAQAILHPRGEATGSGRAFYQQATIRSEHPVDLGLLSKPDRYGYAYHSPAESLLRGIGKDVGVFLERDFARTYSRTVYGFEKSYSKHDVWPYFLRAYDILKDRLGYAGFEACAVLTQVYAADADEWFEISSIKSAIGSPTGSFRTRVGIGRSGKPEYVKVEDGPL